MKKEVKPTQAEFRKAEKAVDNLLVKMLGRDDYGDAYARGLVIDRRVHEHFPYRPESRTDEESEQRYTDAIICAEINLHLATKQLEQVNREFRYWLEDRRYRQAVEDAISKAVKAPAGYKLIDLASHIYCEVYSAPNNGSQSRPEPAEIAKEVSKNIKQRLPGRNIEQLYIASQYSTRIYAVYTPTVEEVEAKLKQQQAALADVNQALTPAGIKARKYSNTAQRQAFIQRAKANREHTLQAIKNLQSKL